MLAYLRMRGPDCLPHAANSLALMPIVDSRDLNVSADEEDGQQKLPRSVHGRRRLFAVIWAIAVTVASLAWLYLIAAATWAVASKLLF